MFYKVSEALQADLNFRQSQPLRKSAGTFLTESVRFSEHKTFDVFLSHSFLDAEIVFGVKILIEQQGKTVYVDWIEDKLLDREKVTAATAEVLRHRMRASSTLVYASSSNTGSSKWMPWELGFFDGFKPGMVSILPLVERDDSEWKGQEYLGLYPVINRLELYGVRKPFVVRSDKKAQPFASFGSSESYIWADVYGKAV